MKLFTDPYVKRIILIFIAWRLILFTIAYLSPSLIPEIKQTYPYRYVLIDSGLSYWIWSFGNFDGVHYLRLAQEGYTNLQFTQAFFPVYPILIKLVSFVTVGNFLIAGLLISNISFFFALLLFYKLIREQYNQNIALWSSIFLISFPTSFFFGSVYSEGLFFLLIIGSFYLLELKKILLASVVGAFASATRLVGVFLAPALIRGNYLWSLLPLLIIPIGLVGYSIYLQVEFGDPLYFLTAQNVWGQERSTQIVLLPQVFFRYLKILLTSSGLPLLTSVFELTATVFAIVVLILATKKVQREWLIFSWIAVITPTLTGTLASMPRYILIAFPIYIVLAQIKSTVIKFVILAIFIVLLATTTLLFTRGYWVA